MSSVPCTSPACRRQSPFISWCFFVPFLLSVMLLITYTDAVCGPPERYESMKLKGTSQESYAVGAMVEYECRLGFMQKPSFGTTAVCNGNNSWSLIQEACTRKLCSNPGEPKNGYVILVNKTLEFGSQVDFACNEGYRLIGQKTIYCELAERNSVDWSNNLPVCDVAKCIPPKDIQNGEYSNYGKDVYDYNEAVRYRCNAHEPDPYSLVGAQKLFCTTTGEWSSEPPQCKVVKCVFPVVENGEIMEGHASKFYYNAKVTFQCQKGFTMTGNRTTVCEETSSWAPPLPQCVKDAPPSSPNSAVTYVPGLFPSTQQPPISNLLDGGSIAVIIIALLQLL